MQVCFTKRIVESHFVPILPKNEKKIVPSRKFPVNATKIGAKRIGSFLAIPRDSEKQPENLRERK